MRRRRRTGSVLVAATVLGGVALCAFSLVAVSRRRPQPRLRRRWFEARDERGWDKVDEASYGSFPASDPPGFYSGAAELR